ncbi:MAG: hypothetical protein V4655_09235 [Bdellovibrionota bacterium]
MKREWTQSLHAHGFARGDLASYLFCAIAGLVFINCAHQDDDHYITRRPKEMVSPPAVPPRGPVPALPTAPLSVPIPQTPGSASVSVPKPRSEAAANKPAQNAPTVGKINLSALQLKMDSSLSPPVKRLVSNAEESLKKGRVLEARAQADRAYRMNLRDPRTSFLLAKVSVLEKDYDGAEQWAMRSLEYVDDEANKAVIWGLIARAREKAGNKPGVAEALKKRDSVRR